VQLYNTFTNRNEPFAIPTDRPVTIYVCGVTPYDTTHVGHARTYLIFDTLMRHLRAQGATIRYCQNVTDVDDPLFERAQRDNIAWQDLASRETQRFVDDCDALNMTRPDYFPRASEEITTMLPIIEQLIALGHAYVADGNVYFDITSDPTFGEIARMGYDQLLATANQRGNNPNDPRKRDPLDFVLWQTGNPGDPIWESPWGMGRPGWHIECSAMATRYLGDQIDIHGGGNDLIFPHHACEIAQTEPVTGKKPFSRFWLHTGMVSLHGQKMSKSLGNLVFAHQALERHTPNALRWYLLSQPYQNDFDYVPDAVNQTETLVAQLTNALTTTGGPQTPLDATRARDAFTDALNDNLNTPLALTVLHTLVHDTLTAAHEQRDIAAAQQTLAHLATTFGLQIPPEE
jgi:L-cysteine:1D-myo-inositol 2-amino-2-deoxy-alpha-D-glucopyranoside ligase